MPSMLPALLRWTLYVYAGYLALCLFVLMPALNMLAPKLVDSALNRQLQSELILFNPFTLTLEARKLLIIEADGHEPLGFDSLRINLSLESLWRPGVVLDGFYIEELDIHVLRKANGEFHFADLSAESSADNPRRQASPMGITIHNLLVEAHTLRFTDETRPGPYTTAQSNFRVRTSNLTTVPQRQSAGDLVLTGDGGGTLRWHGELELDAGVSKGQITLQDIDLRPLWRYESESLPFVVNSANLSAVLNYDLDWNANLQAKLSESQLRLHDTNIVPTDPTTLPNTSLELSDFSIAGINLDLQQAVLAITTASITGLNIKGFDEQGEPSLLAMFGLGSDDKNAADAAQTQSEGLTGESENSPKEWTINVDAVELGNSDLQWRTSYLSPKKMHLSPVDIKVNQITWPAKSRSPFSVFASINETATLALTGDLNIANGNADISLDVGRWPLPWLNPLVKEQARVSINRGELSAQSNIHLQAFAPTTVAARLEINDYSTVLDSTDEEAFTFQSLGVDGIAVNLPEQTVKVDSLVLQRPSGSLHILENGTININGIVRDSPAEVPSPPAEDSQEQQSQPWRLQLAKVMLREGRLDFADASLPLHFKTLIDGIEADINNIDTASREPLTLAFKGAVDGYAPVDIIGSGKPMAERRDGEVQFTFRGMDIATMSPYSGTYAGYTLDSGTLSLDLRYALDGQTLDGDNRIVISQMELGDPVESDLAIDVPLKLGIALLTDSAGVIDLSVPINGDIDAPDFSLGPIIGTAIKNIIIKAVTAPFSLLASLVGSEDDLENVAFPAGLSEPDTDAQGALSALAKALGERPQLSLRIAGGADPVSDGAALKEELLKTELLAEGFDAAMIETHSAAFLDALQIRYAALPLSEQAMSEQAMSEPSQESADEAPAAISPEAMWNAVVRASPLPPTALQDLATARAASAKRELVTVGKIDPARISISYEAELITSGVQMTVDG